MCMLHAAFLTAGLLLLNDVNQERSARGLAPLLVDARLSEVAAQHAADMSTRGYFSHTTPQGQTPFDRMRAAGCIYGRAAENIAIAPNEQTADKALFASAEHRENLLNPTYVRIGIGVSRGAGENSSLSRISRIKGVIGNYRLPAVAPHTCLWFPLGLGLHALRCAARTLTILEMDGVFIPRFSGNSRL